MNKKQKEQKENKKEKNKNKNNKNKDKNNKNKSKTTIYNNINNLQKDIIIFFNLYTINKI